MIKINNCPIYRRCDVVASQYAFWGLTDLNEAYHIDMLLPRMGRSYPVVLGPKTSARGPTPQCYSQ